MPQIAINDVYLPYLDEMSRVQVFYGGASSGKSVFVAQRAVTDVAQGGRNYLVCRAVGRTIRRSVMNEIRKVIADAELTKLFDVNRSDGIITCKNGYQILFAGLDDVEKIKSITPERGALTDVWVEEATETSRDSVRQLMKRQRGGDESVAKRLTLTFNPILQTHWIYEDYFASIGWADKQTQHKANDLSILKTWYIHNKFLTQQDIEGLENEKDKYYRDVYTYGNWGVLGNVIFTNWRVEDLSEMRNQFTNRRNGLDFGFASDPAAIVCTHYDTKRKTIYVFDELYERGLTNDLLAAEVKRMMGSDIVTCDSAEPKSIAELQKFSVNATGAKKGKDSVTWGIDWLKQQEIVIDSRCVNLRNELLAYKWKEDAGGNAIRVPVDKNNHLIDALRYAYESEAGGATWYF